MRYVCTISECSLLAHRGLCQTTLSLISSRWTTSWMMTHPAGAALHARTCPPRCRKAYPTPRRQLDPHTPNVSGGTGIATECAWKAPSHPRFVPRVVGRSLIDALTPLLRRGEPWGQHQCVLGCRRDVRDGGDTPARLSACGTPTSVGCLHSRYRWQWQLYKSNSCALASELPHTLFRLNHFAMVTNTPSVEKSLHDLDVKGQDIEHREDNPDATGSSPPDSVSVDLEYKDENEEPVLHRRTYFALLALFLLNYTQVVALNGPPSVVSMIASRSGHPLTRNSSRIWARMSTVLQTRLGFLMLCPLFKPSVGRSL